MSSKKSASKLSNFRPVISLILGFGVSTSFVYAETDAREYNLENVNTTKVMMDDGECAVPVDQSNNKQAPTEQNHENQSKPALQKASSINSDNYVHADQIINSNRLANTTQANKNIVDSVRYVSFFTPVDNTPVENSFEKSKNHSFKVVENLDNQVDDAEDNQEKIVSNQVTKTIDLTLKSKDLWKRIHNGFAMPNLENDLVKKHQAYYEKYPSYVKRMVTRGSRYLYYIVSELNRRNMPTELALLPMVESAFNPMAYSSAKAAGLWQFIPSTGKQYKLTQDWWQDERRDIVASTNAALDYLQYIYDLHGDWQLALASYNYGENGVAKAIRYNKEKGLPTDYNSLHLPSETKNYVPKLQALKNILGNLTNLAKLDLPTIENKPYFTIVKNPQPIDLSLAAKLAGLSEIEFKELNPAFNRPVIMANERLVIPAENVKSFREKLEKYDGKLTNWQIYNANTGETLAQIANKFAISLIDLKAINGIKKRSSDDQSLLLVPINDNSDNTQAQAIQNDNTALLAQINTDESNSFSNKRSKKHKLSFSKNKKLAKYKARGNSKIKLASSRFLSTRGKKSLQKSNNDLVLKSKKDKSAQRINNKKTSNRLVARSFRSTKLSNSIKQGKYRLIAKK